MLRELDRTSNQLAQDSVQHDRMTQNLRSGRANAHFYALLPGAILIVSFDLPQQRRDRDRGELDAFGLLVEAHGRDQTIELLRQSDQRTLASLKSFPVGRVTDAGPQPLEGALHT